MSTEIRIFEMDYEPAFASQHDKDSASFFKEVSPKSNRPAKSCKIFLETKIQNLGRVFILKSVSFLKKCVFLTLTGILRRLEALASSPLG